MSLYISRHDKHLVLCKNIHFIDVWTLFHLIVSKLKKSMLCHNVKISYITCLTFAKIVSKTQSANMVLGFLYALLCIYSNETLNFPWRHLTRPPLPIVVKYRFFTVSPQNLNLYIKYTVYFWHFFRLFPHIYRLYLFYWCFPDNGSPVIIIFLDYMSSINLFSFNKAINNSVLRCVTYSSGAVEVHTIYQLWSNKNSLVCL